MQNTFDGNTKTHPTFQGMKAEQAVPSRLYDAPQWLIASAAEDELAGIDYKNMFSAPPAENTLGATSRKQQPVFQITHGFGG